MPAASSQTVVLNGVYSIDRIDEMAIELGDALSKTACLEIDLTNVIEFDLPAIQILYATALSAKERNVELKFTGTVAQTVIEKLISSGLSDVTCITTNDFISHLPNFPGAKK